jgi:hypothetical protein
MAASPGGQTCGMRPDISPTEGASGSDAAFDSGTVGSDAGALLLGCADEAIGLIDRLAGCFDEERDPDLIEHTVRTLIGQRVFGMALGYEDLKT